MEFKFFFFFKPFHLFPPTPLPHQKKKKNLERGREISSQFEDLKG